jgi:alpha-galactosidase
MNKTVAGNCSVSWPDRMRPAGPSSLLRTVLLAALLTDHLGRAAEAGLARTPPMGWNSWNHFHLEINDTIIRAQAAALVSSGMKAAGYEYVVIDGGWEGFHDAQGLFHPDPQKFTDMKALCDYIHSLGLKAGIHTSPGPTTCKGREASYRHEKQDAETFARWGIDFVKYDWCSGDEVYKPDEMRSAYRKMHQALVETGRPILYSLCQYGIQDVWKWGPEVGGQMWRTTSDIADNYNRMLLIGFAQNGLEKYAGPGRWNDPDMLEIGNGGMKDEEYRTQMTLWCVLAAPLFAGNDLTKMTPATLEILTNAEAIAIDQDAAGIQGHRAWQEGPTEIWLKPLADHGVALAVLNTQTRPVSVTVDFKQLGLPETLRVRDLWAHKEMGTVKRNLTVPVAKHGAVLLKVEPETTPPRGARSASP